MRSGDRHSRTRAGTRVAVGVAASAYFAGSVVACVEAWIHPDTAIGGGVLAAALLLVGTGTVRLRRWALRTTAFLCIVALVLAVPAFFPPFAFDVISEPRSVGERVAMFSLFSLLPLSLITIATLLRRDLD